MFVAGVSGGPGSSGVSIRSGVWAISGKSKVRELSIELVSLYCSCSLYCREARIRDNLPPLPMLRKSSGMFKVRELEMLIFRNSFEMSS